MPKRTGDFDNWLLQQLTDPELAASYINTAMSEDPELLPIVLREVARAYTMKKVAKDAGVARESLYAILSASGNPTLSNLTAVLKAVRLKIAVVPDSRELGARGSVPEHSLVAGRLRMDTNLLIGGLTRTANTSPGIPETSTFSAADLGSGMGYFSLKTQPGLGGGAGDVAALTAGFSGLGNALQTALHEQSGVADTGRTAIVPVETYAGEPAWSAAGGSQQLVP